MRKLVIVLLLTAICCSACSYQSYYSKDASENSTIAAKRSSGHSSAVPLPETNQDDQSSFSSQEEAGVESAITSTTDYHGLVLQAQWEALQYDKKEYGHLSKQEREILYSNGKIQCSEFLHMRWEHFVAIPLILYVGADEFEAWLDEIDSENNPDNCTIYSFAEYFSLSYKELVFVIEAKDLANYYDMGTLKSRFEYFIGDLETGSEFDPSTVQFADSTIPVHQGFTQEQWDILQYQKRKYGHCSEEERGSLSFNGYIDCPEFDHLKWEFLFDLYLINHVGGDEFESWLREVDSYNNAEEADIYRFANYFSISLDELVSLIETNNLTHIYDVDTVKRRYEYFVGDQ